MDKPDSKQNTEIGTSTLTTEWKCQSTTLQSPPPFSTACNALRTNYYKHNMKTVVYYHKAGTTGHCPDGELFRIMVRNLLFPNEHSNPPVEYRPFIHGVTQIDSESLKDSQVIFGDMFPIQSVFAAIQKVVTMSVTVDHHQPNLATLKQAGLSATETKGPHFVFFDTERCASQILFDCITPCVVSGWTISPEIIHSVNLQDLGKAKLLTYNQRCLNFGLNSVDGPTMEKFIQESIHHRNVDFIRDIGKPLLKKAQESCQKRLETVTLAQMNQPFSYLIPKPEDKQVEELCTFRCVYVDIAPDELWMPTELCVFHMDHPALKGHDIVICRLPYDQTSNKRAFKLRAIESSKVDFNTKVKQMQRTPHGFAISGGGHPHAAGFDVQGDESVLEI